MNTATKNKETLNKDYDLLEVEQQLIKALLHIRKTQNLTQSDLASLMGTSQANISKLENGKLNPSVAFLKRLAQACDVKLNVHFR